MYRRLNLLNFVVLKDIFGHIELRLCLFHLILYVYSVLILTEFVENVCTWSTLRHEGDETLLVYCESGVPANACGLLKLLL